MKQHSYFNDIFPLTTITSSGTVASLANRSSILSPKTEPIFVFIILSLFFLTGLIRSVILLSWWISILELWILFSISYYINTNNRQELIRWKTYSIIQWEILAIKVYKQIPILNNINLFRKCNISLECKLNFFFYFVLDFKLLYRMPCLFALNLFLLFDYVYLILYNCQHGSWINREIGQVSQFSFSEAPNQILLPTLLPSFFPGFHYFFTSYDI